MRETTKGTIMQRVANSAAMGMAALGLAGCWTYTSRSPAIGPEISVHALADGQYCALAHIAGAYEIDPGDTDCMTVSWDADAASHVLHGAEWSAGEPGAPAQLLALDGGLHLAQLRLDESDATYTYAVIAASPNGFVFVDDAGRETVEELAEEIGGLTLSFGSWGGVMIESGPPDAMIALITQANAARLAEIVADGVFELDEATYYMRLDDPSAAPSSDAINEVVDELQGRLQSAADAIE